MQVEISVESDLWDAAALQALANRFCAAALAHLQLDPSRYEISLLACDDARIAALNGDFRDKARPTNVLSWPSEERGAPVDGAMPDPPQGPDPELGDIAIAFETCAREAAEQGKAFDAHLGHLLVHSTLHLLGFDHIRPGDAALMEGIEVEILASLGLPDPYE